MFKLCSVYYCVAIICIMAKKGEGRTFIKQQKQQQLVSHTCSTYMYDYVHICMKESVWKKFGLSLPARSCSVVLYVLLYKWKNFSISALLCVTWGLSVNAPMYLIWSWLYEYPFPMPFHTNIKAITLMFFNFVVL